jgi:hypothetical protein
MAQWVGLGGTDHADELIQAGTETDFNSPYTNTFAWYEYVGNDGTVNSQQLNMTVHCGDHFWVKVAVPNWYYVYNYTTGAYLTFSWGPQAGQHSAEAIVERPTFGTWASPLTDFNPDARLQGVGITESHQGIGYQPIWNLWHDYSHMYDYPGGNGNGGAMIARTNGLYTDWNDYPYDDFSITWLGTGSWCNGCV